MNNKEPNNRPEYISRHFTVIASSRFVRNTNVTTKCSDKSGVANWPTITQSQSADNGDMRGHSAPSTAAAASVNINKPADMITFTVHSIHPRDCV